MGRTAVSARSNALWAVATILLFALLLAANPVGYRGGGADDWQYLQAARCWVENGPCLPRDHWWGRWPLVASLAGLIDIFGESRTTLALVPFAATLGCGFLVAHIGNRLFGAPAGWIAAMLLLSTPVVLFEALDPTIDAIELLFMLAGGALLLSAKDRGSLLFTGCAGLMFGLAFQARETSIAVLPAAGLFLLLRARPFWPAAIAFGAGALAPLLIELLVYGQATGDPLFRRHLSVAHTSLPSSEIAVATPRGALPFFRWELIAGWQHETGISVHWLVDGPLDVLLNAKGGWTLLAATLVLVVFGRRLDERQRRTAWRLLLLAAFAGAMLIYAFSIDPKPRMMLVPLAAGALVLGALLVRMPRWTAAPLLLARVAALSLVYLFEPRMAAGEAAARSWLATLPAGSVETTESTRRRLALVPDIERLPLADGSRPLLLIRTSRPCASARIHDLAPPRTLRLVAEQRLGNRNPLSAKYRALCLFRYGSPEAARALAATHDAVTSFTDEAAEPKFLQDGPDVKPN
ncbi:glycosyltransferase family 39 protein [Sphingomonas sp. LHG3406-1]|uniref:ArnT family glycosyltransferase n=1 Tax=Sphingomonas sp. LHG3406-1 TaxID=2804617 RepID=UPI0026262ECB|nr:glycosyltransferase family 39 protein [Sphingomonas sp. LHG3406-1]